MKNEQSTMSSKHRAMKKAFALLSFLCCLAFSSSLYAQTADRIEWLLGQQQVSYQDAALLALQAAGHAGPDAGAAEAFAIAAERGWLPKGAKADGEAALDGLSLLVMQAFGLKGGGALFSLFKSPHYAYRAMAYLGIVSGRADPQMPVSGDFLLYAVNRAAYLSEGGEQ